MPAPAGTPGSDRPQEGQVGETDGPVPAPALEPEVEPGQAGDEQEEPQPGRGEQGHRRRLLPTTNRTMSISQSRSVDSTRWAAPAARTARALPSACSAAAAAKRAR